MSHRRRLVVQLYLDGLSQADIAAHLKINQATVSRDLREAGRDGSIPEVRALRRADEAALAHLDSLEWVLWEMRDLVHEEFFIPRTVRNPRTGRETTTRMISGLPVGDTRFLDWLIRCAQLRQRIQRRMDKRQLCGFINIQKQMMRIEAAVQSLGQRHVGEVSEPAEAQPDGSLAPEESEQTASPPLLPLAKGGNDGAVEQVFQPAESSAAQVLEPGLSIPGSEGSTDEHPVSNVAGWKTCPTTDDGERRGVSPPVGTQASHRSTRVTTRSRTGLQASVSRRSTGGLTSRRSPKAPIGRIDLKNYAKTIAGICRQTSAGQSIATKSAARISRPLPKPRRLTDHRSRQPVTVRQRGPPPRRRPSHLRFPLSALRFWISHRSTTARSLHFWNSRNELEQAEATSALQAVKILLRREDFKRRFEESLTQSRKRRGCPPAPSLAARRNSLRLPRNSSFGLNK